MDCVFYNSTLGETTFSVACNYNNGSVNLVTGNVEYSDYGYLLTSWATYTFLVAFAVATFCHVMLGVYWRTWWALPTLGLGTLGEAVGWASRVWSIKSTVWESNYGGMWTDNHNSFIAQICCTVISPTLFSAANYILLGKLVTATGQVSPPPLASVQCLTSTPEARIADPRRNRYCSLTPKSLAIAFMMSDFLCLIVQAAGGGWAGTADTTVDSDKGAKVMTAGVILQLVVTVVYVVVLGEFLYRRHKDLPVHRQVDLFGKTCCRTKRDKSPPSSPSINELSDVGPSSSAGPSAADRTRLGRNVDLELIAKQNASYESMPAVPRQQQPAVVTISRRMTDLMVAMIILSTLLIIVRSVYRSIELSNGWSGPVATNEPLFLGLDALLMAILVWAYVLIHPGVALGRGLFAVPIRFPLRR